MQSSLKRLHSVASVSLQPVHPQLAVQVERPDSGSWRLDCTCIWRCLGREAHVEEKHLVRSAVSIGQLYLSARWEAFAY
jgi:hypothetical protein